MKCIICLYQGVSVSHMLGTAGSDWTLVVVGDVWLLESGGKCQACHGTPYSHGMTQREERARHATEHPIVTEWPRQQKIVKPGRRVFGFPVWWERQYENTSPFRLPQCNMLCDLWHAQQRTSGKTSLFSWNSNKIRIWVAMSCLLLNFISSHLLRPHKNSNAWWETVDFSFLVIALSWSW